MVGTPGTYAATRTSTGGDDRVVETGKSLLLAKNIEVKGVVCGIEIRWYVHRTLCHSLVSCCNIIIAVIKTGPHAGSVVVRMDPLWMS